MLSLPAAFLAEYGTPKTPQSSHQIESASEELITFTLLERCQSVAAQALGRSQHKDIRVITTCLPKLEPRVFTYWRKEEPSIYVIACNIGTTELARRILIDNNFQTLLPDSCVALRTLHPDDVLTLAVSLILCTLLYHELAHVVRFHLPYKAECSDDIHQNMDELKGMCEVDADKWSSYLIAPELSAQAAGIRRALAKASDTEHILREVLCLYALVLHLWFSFFNKTTFRIPSFYPHPLIRSTRIAVGAADNIDRTLIAPHLSIERAAFVLQGLASIEELLLSKADIAQKPFDLADEMRAIETRFAEVSRLLDPALVNTARKWGTNAA